MADVEDMFLSPLDMLLDENNNDNIVLFREGNEPIEFEQIAIVPMDERLYAILKPIIEEDEFEEDEAFLFEICNVDDEDVLLVVEDEEIIKNVFEVYYDMLRAG